MALAIKSFYEFGPFALDPEERVLMRNGVPVQMTPKVFDTLLLLVQNQGRVVSKEEMLNEIWHDSFVEESNLTFNIRKLRQALGDEKNSPTYIETVPKRGYRFKFEVKEVLQESQFAPVTEIRLIGSRSMAEVKENFEAVSDKSQLNKEDITGKTQSDKNDQVLSLHISKKSYLTVAALLLFIVSIAIGSWYLRKINARSASSAPILSQPFRSEKFSTSGNVALAVISPDGKYVAYTDETNGKYGIWRRQLETSESNLILPPSNDFYGGLAFSRDGNWLYFMRKPQDESTPSAIYRVSALGGIPVKIVDKTQGSISVSPDDKQISFVRCEYKDDDFCSLFVTDADGKNERKLLTRKRPIRIGDNQFSPDGKSIAFAVGQSWNGGNDFGLSQIEIASGAEREITPKKFFNIKSLKWLPDGDGLLFTAMENLDGKTKIWQVSTATGEARALTKDAADYSHISLDKNADKMIATQVSNDFRLCLSSTGNQNDSRILTAARDFAFAPDGKIIYSTFEGDIWTINADGGEQRQLTNNPFMDFHPHVSPDGRYIYFTSNRTGSNQVWRMNADGSNQTQLTKTEGGYPRFVTPDGKWVYFKSGLHLTFWKVATNGGEETQVDNLQLYGHAFSPDGNLIAYFFRDKQEDNQMRIGIRNLEDQKLVKVLRYVDNKSRPLFLVWSSDNRTLKFITYNDSKYSLWQQSLDEDQPRFIADLGSDEIEHFAVLPDGNGFAFIRGRWIHDAVLIDGLK